MQLSSLTYNLEDNEILEDLKIINKNKAFSVSETHCCCRETTCLLLVN